MLGFGNYTADRIEQKAQEQVEVMAKNYSSDNVHGALDVAGLVPGLGEAADALNAGLYLLEAM